jgi:hypothetical protein
MPDKEKLLMRVCACLFILITVLDLVNPGIKGMICNSFGNTREYIDIQK